ncbi:Ppx/GppA family phosphatase [Sphingomonas naphthae]|uniref:Ppx/GppA family phosphatase n=1 Tax=Sphingomonas naphthae TaxID=1813468 RepID=A0ABY7TQ05_9SPHN|nr:Ppx/GppA family phosphatase [Sphingomonas naphthae]WCT75208.1 Ppx/GppA family phosphatase [Sphingomonas naphthae]
MSLSTTLPFIRKAPPAPEPGRVAIVDIGSNSVRLVIYDGPARIPSILFNEKIMAGLGRGLAKDGALDREAMERTLSALGRFRRLAMDMGVAEPRVVATAAVRDASNGPDFLTRLRALGLSVELLPGEVEAALAGYGVLAGIPAADGIVGDLGGGSLELIRVRDGEVHERASFPLGVLRVAAIRKKGPRALDRTVAKALKGVWEGAGQGLPFYLVGGSWRALARLHMTISDHPLPILHQYRMDAAQAAHLVRVVAQLPPKKLREFPGVAASRAPALSDAAALLAVLVRHLNARDLIVSAYGLREGLLHQSLPPEIRNLDPLIEATRQEGVRQGRFPEHGDLLDRWIAPLFPHEDGEMHRVRHAACLLADVGWRAHPDFRAERGLDTALHGNWVGIDATGRAMLGQALWTSFGGRGVPPTVAALTTPAQQATAESWGLALRLGQRLSGGVAQPLHASRLALQDGAVALHLGHGDGPLYGEAVERRHKSLAAAFGLRAVVA